MTEDADKIIIAANVYRAIKKLNKAVAAFHALAEHSVELEVGIGDDGKPVAFARLSYPDPVNLSLRDNEELRQAAKKFLTDAKHFHDHDGGRFRLDHRRRALEGVLGRLGLAKVAEAQTRLQSTAILSALAQAEYEEAVELGI
jgi:hypothetical protein